MKIRIELEEGLLEDEVVIRCRSLTDEITRIQNAVSAASAAKQNLVLYKEDTEYYVALDEILFFETESNGINAHTRDNVYQVKYRLYELEEMLRGISCGFPNQQLSMSGKFIPSAKAICPPPVWRLLPGLTSRYLCRDIM